MAQGQLIAESGTISGGGGRPSRGRMALGSSAPKANVDVKAAQAELKQAEQQLEAATQASRREGHKGKEQASSPLHEKPGLRGGFGGRGRTSGVGSRVL